MKKGHVAPWLKDDGPRLTWDYLKNGFPEKETEKLKLKKRNKSLDFPLTPEGRPIIKPRFNYKLYPTNVVVENTYYGRRRERSSYQNENSGNLMKSRYKSPF